MQPQRIAELVIQLQPTSRGSAHIAGEECMPPTTLAFGNVYRGVRLLHDFGKRDLVGEHTDPQRTGDMQGNAIDVEGLAEQTTELLEPGIHTEYGPRSGWSLNLWPVAQIDQPRLEPATTAGQGCSGDVPR